MLPCGNQRHILVAAVGVLLSVVCATSQPAVSPEKAGLLPSACIRSGDGRKVACHTDSWPTLPPSVSRSLSSLNVTGLQQSGLKAANLRNLAGLALLAVTDGLLSKVSRDVFSGLLQLETLDLSRNLLSDLPTDVFMDNTRLKNLVLAGNPIALPSSGPFLRCTSLHYLDISSCNLPELPSEVFTCLPQLQELHIGNNHLSEYPVDALRPLSSLRTVYHDVHIESSSSPPINMQHILYISFMSAATVSLFIIGYKAIALAIKSRWCRGCAYQEAGLYFLMGDRKLVPRSFESVPMAGMCKERQPPLLGSRQPQGRSLPAPPSGCWTPPSSRRLDIEYGNGHVYESLSTSDDYHRAENLPAH